MNFSAVILAGGKSSRMGIDKAFLEIEGQKLLTRQIELAHKVGATEVFISGRSSVDYFEFGCHVLEDKFQNVGPLAGIERALAESPSPLVLVLAVDLPNMTADFLRQLTEHCGQNTGAIPRLKHFIEPLAAFYPKSAQALAEKALGHNCFAVKDFAVLCVQSGFAHFIDVSPVDAKFFANWNSPADFNSNREVQR